MTDESTANYCGACGEPMHGARFCSNCGAPTFARHAAEPIPGDVSRNGEAETVAGSGEQATAVLADTVTAPVRPSVVQARSVADAPTGRTFDRGRGEVPPESPSLSRPRRRAVLIAAVVALLLAAAAAAVIFLVLPSRDDQPSAAANYRHRVAGIFGPVLGSNRQVSRELARLRGTHPTGARAAVRQAREAMTTARGALGALTVPAGQQALASSARQVLDHESAYLAAVAGALAHPTTASVASLDTLSSNLTAGLDAGGPTIAGTGQTVSGTGRLTAWVHQTRRALKRQAKRRAAKRAAASSGSAATGTGAGSGATTNPYADGRDCGGGLFAGPNTSCAFAENVRDAYNEAPGLSATVQVYSPVTDQTYTMDCAPSGSGVTCSGANNASVSF